MNTIAQIPFECWQVLTQMAPYLLFGFFMAGALSVFISPAWVERHLGGKGMMPVIKASMFGVPMPLCSCSVIPVTTGLIRHGASKAAATSFLLSTPQTGVDSFFATWGMMGPVIAIFRVVVAFITGIVGGALTLLAERPTDPAANDAGAPPACQDECCGGAHKRGRLARVFRYGFVTLPRDIAKALLLGIVLAGIISALMPDSFFEGFMGQGFVQMLLMMALGIPLYVCSTGSIPVAAALMMKGISPGAALVFLITGPATNAATVAVVWKILGRRVALVYLATVAGCALLAGFLFNGLLAGSASLHLLHHDVTHTSPLGTVSAILLLASLLYALMPTRRQK